MRTQALIFAICILPRLLSAQAPDTAAQLSETRTILEEWVRTEAQISQESSQWEVEKRILQDIAQVASHEIEILQQGIAKIRASQTSGEHEKDTLLQRRQELDTLVQRLERYLPLLEQQLLDRIQWFPHPLLDTISLHSQKLSAAQDTPANFVSRAQNIAVILREADSFNAKVSLDRPVLQLDGTQGKVYNVLYFGLGAAYFVDETGSTAGFGTPARGGWKWNREDKLAPLVRDAVQVFESQIPAKFIHLPVHLQDITGTSRK
jgi:hypothetical protein